MNVLILNWRDIKHPLAGGAEKMLLEHAMGWQKKGANILWFSSYVSGLKEEVIDGVRYVRRGSVYTVFIWAFLHYMKGNFQQIDVVVDCFHFIPFFARFYMFNKKIVAVIHEVARELWFKNIFFPVAFVGYFLEPIVIKMYSGTPFITVSKSTEDDLRKIGINQNKIFIIPNGVDIPSNIPRKKSPSATIVYLGHVAKDKGIEDALRVIKILKDKGLSIKLDVVGREQDDAYLRYLKALCNGYKISQNVEWHGYVSNHKKNSLLARAWFLIHPSIREGWGINVLEANSLGTAVVGYNVAGLRDSIKNNATGLLVEKSPDAMAEACEKLILNPVLLKKLSASAFKYAKEFKWDKSTAKSYKLLASF